MALEAQVFRLGFDEDVPWLGKTPTRPGTTKLWLKIASLGAYSEFCDVDCALCTTAWVELAVAKFGNEEFNKLEPVADVDVADCL